VAPITSLSWQVYAPLLRAREKTLNIPNPFLVDGMAPSTGDIFKNPDLAESLKLVAEKGSDGFYKGMCDV